jgi:hypothetical protein
MHMEYMAIRSIATWFSIPNMCHVPYIKSWKHGCKVGVSPKERLKNQQLNIVGFVE